MARTFADRTLDIGSRPGNILSEFSLLEHEIGDLGDGNSYLESLIKISRDGTTGSRFMNLTASARVALTVPIIAKITGLTDHLESAVSASVHVLEHPQATALSIGQTHAGLAMLAVISGDAESARKQYDTVKDWPHTFLFFSISADRLLGLLAQTMGERDQASAHFEDALKFCRSGGYRPELAWTCYDYATALARAAKPSEREQAASLLEEGLSIATKLGMTPLAGKLTELQTEMDSAPARRPAYPDGLTQREV